MIDDELYIAVDLGAGSGRVMLGGLAPGELLIEEVRRFHYPEAERGGHLRWDLGRIVGDVTAGLAAAAARARELGRTVRSVGVDTWGVDYGLVDERGGLVEDPICYRDHRTVGEMERVCAVVPRDEIFTRTGIQFLPFNTIFQLSAHLRAGFPAGATRLLMIPDLLHRALSGTAVTEYTNASTTQLLDARTRRWDGELVARLGLPAHFLPEIVEAGTDLGPLLPEVAAAAGLGDVRVVAPATHDTGSAVAGAPLRDGWAYISSGTWSLVGVERETPLVSADVERENFTNEGGAFGTFRFLKNVSGLWLLEACRKEWQARGLDVDHDRLLAQVAARDDVPGLVFPDDQKLLNPPSMTAALAAQLADTGQQVATDPVTMTKVILDSLALRYASVLRTASRLTGRAIAGVHIVGGGSRNGYLDQASADASGLPLLAGPVEATAIGNMMVQAIAAGRFASLAEARQHVAENVELRRFTPRAHSPLALAAERRYRTSRPPT